MHGSQLPIVMCEQTVVVQWQSALTWFSSSGGSLMPRGEASGEREEEFAAASGSVHIQSVIENHA